MYKINYGILKNSNTHALIHCTVSSTINAHSDSRSRVSFTLNHQHQMEVNGQLHTHATLPYVNKYMVPT